MKCVVAVSVFLMCGTAVYGQQLSGSRPGGTPRTDRWPAVSQEEAVSQGTFRLANTSISFVLSVRPGHPGLWEVSRFRTCDYAAQVCDPETVVWLKYNRATRRGAFIAFYRLQGKWHRLPAGSPEEAMERHRLRRLFLLATQLRDGHDPGTLVF